MKKTYVPVLLFRNILFILGNVQCFGIVSNMIYLFSFKGNHFDIFVSGYYTLRILHFFERKKPPFIIYLHFPNFNTIYFIFNLINT